MDLSRCHCKEPGFCDFFQRTMGSDPPDWKWCQTTSKDERSKFFEILSRSPKHAKPVLTITKNEHLYSACKKIIPYIIKNNINGIVGIPRSGMIPASLLSVFTSLPLFSIEKDRIVKLSSFSDNGGWRMQNFNGEIDNLLFIDDTCYGGISADHTREIFGKDIKIAVVFSTTRGLKHIDFFAEILEPPHFLEWNFFNCSMVVSAMFDIDGVFCPNVPVEIAIDEEKYKNWITNIDPYFDRIPKLFRASKIITGRLDKYRDITEAWLKKHKFNYDQLIMFPTERQKERDNNHYFVVGNYKADYFNSFDDNFFVESEHSEASVIKSRTNKVVFCIEDQLANPYG